MGYEKAFEEWAERTFGKGWEKRPSTIQAAYAGWMEGRTSMLPALDEAREKIKDQEKEMERFRSVLLEETDCEAMLGSPACQQSLEQKDCKMEAICALVRERYKGRGCSGA